MLSKNKPGGLALCVRLRKIHSREEWRRWLTKSGRWFLGEGRYLGKLVLEQF